MEYLVRLFTNFNQKCIEEIRYKEPPLLPRVNERIFLEDTRDTGVLKEYKVIQLYHNWPDGSERYFVDILIKKVAEY